MIDSPPEVMHFAIDFHERIVEMTPPMCLGPHTINPLPPDFSGEQRAEAVPPKPDGFIADVDATLMHKIFDIAK
jgi:hypothetical protein